MNEYAPFVRQQCDLLYSDQWNSTAWRCTRYYDQAVDLLDSMISGIMPSSGNNHKSRGISDLEELLAFSAPPVNERANVSPACTTTWNGPSPIDNTAAAFPNSVQKAGASPSGLSPASERQESSSTTPHSGPSDVDSRPAGQKVEANACFELCGYRPKGDPQWFKGSMAKHKKLQHSTAPPIIYKCPYPGCTSQYKNRADNLRQHQIDKGHFVDGEVPNKRPSKRKKM